MMNWEWFNTGAGAASMVGLIVTIGGIIQAIITGRSTRRLQADIHASTQLTLIDMRKGFTESHERLAESQKAIAEAVGGIGKILDRMDQRAEERYRDLRGRIEGEV
jgi:hypothetical protein